MPSRLKPEQIVSNTNAFSALKALGKYKPSKTEHSIKHGQMLHDAMTKAQSAEAQAEAALKAARDGAGGAEHAFHDYMLGVKDYVTAEFGASSDELQSLGLKKKSEYKRGGRKPGSATDAA